jgi:hypothetical protein
MIELSTSRSLSYSHQWWVNFYTSLRAELEPFSIENYVVVRDDVLLKIYGVKFCQGLYGCKLQFETEEQMLVFLLKWS